MSRRTARKRAFELVFSLPFHSGDDLDFLMESLLSGKDVPEDEQNFIRDEFFGVARNLEAVDGLIARFSEGWEIGRLAGTDLAVMRLSAYEILYSDAVPVRASINEAVELAREYGTDDSPAFVNGILGKIAAEAEAGGKKPAGGCPRERNANDPAQAEAGGKKPAGGCPRERNTNNPAQAEAGGKRPAPG
ncbi:MAG: transcription antitermination factor NusB [Firmicutes bacterium]|nr:transcription antitermination factor NusB [Bacillota bacterium]